MTEVQNLDTVKKELTAMKPDTAFPVPNEWDISYEDINALMRPHRKKGKQFKVKKMLEGFEVIRIK